MSCKKLEIKKERKNLVEELERIRLDKRKYHDLICDLEQKENYLKNQLAELNVTYTDVDMFPGIIELAIYIPDEYKIYNNGGESCHTYVLEYDGNIFTLDDRPDVSYPYSFDINRMKIGGDKYSGKLPTLVEIYYKNPEKVTTCSALANEGLVAPYDAIVRARDTLGNRWNDKMEFGIVIFHYLLRIFYQKGINDNYELYEIFINEKC